MNDTIRGALVVALIALVVMGLGAAADIEEIVTGALVLLGIAALSLAAGLAQGMSHNADRQGEAPPEGTSRRRLRGD